MGHVIVSSFHIFTPSKNTKKGIKGSIVAPSGPLKFEKGAFAPFFVFGLLLKLSIHKITPESSGHWDLLIITEQ